jgi:hypothetical protein
MRATAVIAYWRIPLTAVFRNHLIAAEFRNFLIFGLRAGLPAAL